jgi:hypothetical protein
MEILCEDSPDVKLFARLEKILRFSLLSGGKCLPFKKSLLNFQNFVYFRGKNSCIFEYTVNNKCQQACVRIIQQAQKLL